MTNMYKCTCIFCSACVHACTCSCNRNMNIVNWMTNQHIKNQNSEQLQLVVYVTKWVHSVFNLHSLLNDISLHTWFSKSVWVFFYANFTCISFLSSRMIFFLLNVLKKYFYWHVKCTCTCKFPNFYQNTGDPNVPGN